VTPKEGCKLVVRNSKGVGQEEFVVDALEVVSFGHAIFFRSLERPKSFLVPTTDYEVLEVREARMVLKTTPLEKGIKIGGGRDNQSKPPREPTFEKESEGQEEEFATSASEEAQSSAAPDARFDKKRDRRHRRRRRGRGDDRDASQEKDDDAEECQDKQEDSAEEAPPKPARNLQPLLTTFPSLLPPPTSLISETMAHFRADVDLRKPLLQEPSENASLYMEKTESIEEREQIPPPLHIPIPEPIRPLDFSHPQEDRVENQEEDKT
jgi:hypothetical protein